MKNRILIILMCILIFMLSVGGTYYIMEYTNLFEEKVTVVKEVEVTTTSLNESINKVYDAVYVVENYKGKNIQSSGTAFVYKADEEYGYLLTNEHVINDATRAVLTAMDGEEIEATILGSDIFLDLAVLRIPVEHIKLTSQIGVSETLNLGDITFTVGSPLGKEYYGSVTKGIVSGKDRLVKISITDDNQDWIMKVIQTDASINPGNSGGPLCNVNGEVIGINTLKYAEEEIEGMGFAIPIEYAMSHVTTLESGQEIERPYLGISLIDLDDSYSLFVSELAPDETIKQGAIVEEVEKDKPGDIAGLKKGDIIVKIDDEPLTSAAYVRYVLYKYEINDIITITYHRDGELLTTEVILSEKYIN